jgi:hypothetical protein
LCQFLNISPQTPENIEEHPDDLDPAAGNIQMEYSFD